MRRIALAGLVAPDAIGALAARFAEAAPELSRGALAIIDSPRSPLDAESSSTPMTARSPVPSRRVIDDALRRLFARLGRGRLSMYPTPRVEYFVRCVRGPACKPHLAALGRELLAGFSENMEHPTIDRGGRLFTRFMLAGFATYAALAIRGVRVFECYPDMEFRLWAGDGGRKLAPKAQRSEALTARRRICAKLAKLAGVPGMEKPRTLDQADAAVLALGVAATRNRGTLVELRNRAEGRFLVAFDAPRAFSTRGLADHALSVRPA